MITLRDYQKECIEEINKAEHLGIRRQIVVLATGSGKTIIFGSLIAERNERSLIIAHTNELLLQAQDKLKMIAPTLSTGLLCSDRKEFDSQVVISSIQSACRPKNLERLKEQNFKIVVIDESHHSAADTYKTVIKALGCSESDGPLLLGFTATAFREDGKGLAEVFDKVTFELGISDLIEKGHLVKPKGIRIFSEIDLGKLELSDGDYKKTSLIEVMDTEEMVVSVVDAYIEHAEFLPTICFGCSILHARHLQVEFKKRGVSSETISGKTPKEEREEILNRFSSGKIDVLTNCSLLCEGIDLPRTEAIIIARPTKSRGLFIQMAGRALRPFPNKTSALILDFGEIAHDLMTRSELFKDVLTNSKEIDKDKELFEKVMKSYPDSLNQRIKLSAVKIELLSKKQGFAWSVDFEGRYFVKGFGSTKLRIDSLGKERYAVRFYKEEEVRKEFGYDLEFDQAFSLASDIVERNKKVFALSDLDALWRKAPASQKQKDFLMKKRLSAGIQGLTKGQAAIIIGSGCFN